MKIQFHSILYDLYAEPNVSNIRLQASIVLGENSYDYLIKEDTLNIKDITIYEDDEETIKAIYSGYTQRVAIVLIDGLEYISIEFENPDIRQLIENLSNTVNQVQEIQTVQQTSINNIEVSKLNSFAVSNEEEHIGQPSKNSYKLNDTFIADGSYYKAVAIITAGNVLVENGNCELTTIDNELNAKKKEEE